MEQIDVQIWNSQWYAGRQRKTEKKFRYDIRLASMSRSEKKNERENKIRNNADYIEPLKILWKMTDAFLLKCVSSLKTPTNINNFRSFYE